MSNGIQRNNESHKLNRCIDSSAMPTTPHYFTGPDTTNWVHGLNSGCEITLEEDAIEYASFDEAVQKQGIEAVRNIMSPLELETAQPIEPEIELLPGRWTVVAAELLLSSEAFNLTVVPLRHHWCDELVEEEVGRNRTLKKWFINFRYIRAIATAVGAMGIIDRLISAVKNCFTSS